MNFILIGAAGFVAPRHFKAIRDIGGDLIAVCDPHDSVGVLDSYFPECMYFRSIEELILCCNKEKRKIDYTVVCSPNYLHAVHSAIAMRLGTDVICEKPAVLYESDLDYLMEVEQKTGKKVYPILQLRHHPDVERYRGTEPGTLTIAYHSPRGKWYNNSWKNDISKSGGVGTNIGVHLFDIASYMFGPCNEPRSSIVQIGNTINGTCYFGKTHTDWSLSISPEYKQSRMFIFDDRSLDLSKSFTDLHTECYRNIVNGTGFSLESCRDAIRTCEYIRK